MHAVNTYAGKTRLGCLLRSPAKARGFSLVELMITVAIIGILSSFAIPSYKDYVTRGRIPDAVSNLATKRVKMEQFYQDNKTYVGAPDCTADTASSKYFDFSCSVAGTASVYTLQAVGKSAMTGFTYTLNEKNEKKTTAAPSGWGTPPVDCWVTAKGGTC